MLVLTELRPLWRKLALIPTLYLTAFVWDTRLAAEPSITRLILIGVILIVLMNARPQGLVGTARVEIALMAASGCSICARCRRASAAWRASPELDLHVDEHEIVSVIGPNGAGKTTLFNLITGVYPPDGGDIVFAGESLLGLEPHEITARGIARTFQTLRLFLNMTVKENVMAAAYSHTKAGIVRSILRTPGMRREEREIAALAEERLAFFGERLMGYRWNQPAYSLSYANRRRLEIARATATKPRLLLLDEPAAGMNPVETHEITELIARLRKEAGLHDPRDRARHARRRGDLRPGGRARPRRQDRRGSFEAVATNERVVEAYLGLKATATK